MSCRSAPGPLGRGSRGRPPGIAVPVHGLRRRAEDFRPTTRPRPPGAWPVAVSVLASRPIAPHSGAMGAHADGEDDRDDRDDRGDRGDWDDQNDGTDDDRGDGTDTGGPGPGDPDLAALAGRARAALVREIDASGAWAADPVWREAFAAVPRHLFVPYYYVAVAGGYERRWGESPDPVARERWLRGAYQDAPLATRLRDGELVSSSSQPSLMARMLAELRVTDGDRVLEIGAGTGYNAALLARRLGDDDLVTSVDLEPEITETARTPLAAAGYRPVV
ncbi:O-methyltransferase, partial [Streptomyces sp. e14]